MELNPQDIVVSFGSTQARAMIGIGEKQHVFSMNPDDVKWSYKNNTVSRDTIGGRVVQILSAVTESMTVSARAGSRRELQILSNNIKNIMQYQIQTGDPVHFKVPSRNWDFLVYIANVASLGWDVTTTSYPFQLTLMIRDDLNGITEKVINAQTFEKLAEGIGYNPYYHGGDPASAMKYIESMLGAIEQVNAGSGGGSTAYEDEAGTTSKSHPCNHVSDSARYFRDEILNKKFPDLPIVGICVCKQIAGTQTWSDHSWGAAIDVGNANTNTDDLQDLAEYAVNNHINLKVKYVIFNNQQWSENTDWEIASYAKDDHDTHVHISFSDYNVDGSTPPSWC